MNFSERMALLGEVVDIRDISKTESPTERRRKGDPAGLSSPFCGNDGGSARLPSGTAVLARGHSFLHAPTDHKETSLRSFHPCLSKQDLIAVAPRHVPPATTELNITRAHLHLPSHGPCLASSMRFRCAAKMRGCCYPHNNLRYPKHHNSTSNDRRLVHSIPLSLSWGPPRPSEQPSPPYRHTHQGATPLGSKGSGTPTIISHHMPAPAFPALQQAFRLRTLHPPTGFQSSRVI